VYLPRGAWHDFWTGGAFAGGRAVSVPAPLDRLPLFVRGGAIIPLGPAVQPLSRHTPAQIQLLIHPDRSSSFTPYEDDGETHAHPDRPHPVRRFKVDAAERTMTLESGALDGDEDVVPAARRYTARIFAPAAPSTVSTADGEPLAWRHEGRYLYATLGTGPRRISIEW